METLLLILETVTIVAVLLSIVYVVGIVWRVEQELDASYKFFAFAIVFFLFSEVLHVYYADGSRTYVAIEAVSKTLFAVFFLIGTLLMRDIVRKLDGEKQGKK